MAQKMKRAYCRLGETDIPPVGCREFDPNWCKLDMHCPFLEEGTEETCEQQLDGDNIRDNK